jgi:microsomal dipeptidase-like Zn-dependent dipeptidase
VLGGVPPGVDLPTGDAQSADLQLIELGNYVTRHKDWMVLVHNSTELYNAVSSNKLAVIAGVEIDNIGGLLGPVPGGALNAAIDHLYALGARYIFPVHLVDNPIGKTAAYEDMFMVANAYEELGQTMHLACAPGINYNYSPASARAAMLINSGVFNGWQAPLPVVCGPGMGNINAADHDANGNVVGLTPAGRQAIQHMMDLGMLIDVDHMSQASVDQVLAMAQANLPTQYPLMSGHNNLRGSAGPGSNKERQLTGQQYQTIGALHGMAGIGGAQSTADQWMATLSLTAQAMGISGKPGVAFGTDADGLEFMMPPRPNSTVNPGVALPPPAIALPFSQDGTKTWDYNHDGVAHYGLLPEFLLDVGSLQNGGSGVVTQMFGGAQYIFQTWYIAERDKKL